MDFGRPAQWAGWPYLLHDAQVQAKHLIWGPHAQTGHNVVVGLTLVHGQLLAVIGSIPNSV